MRALLAFVLLGSVAQAQPQVVGHVHFGVDQHTSLGDLERWQASEREQLALQRRLVLTPTDAFPSHVSAEVAFGMAIPSGEVGVLATTSSTGARLARSDYSGTIVVERIAERIGLGVYAEAHPVQAGPVRVGAGLALRWNQTTVSYRREVTVGQAAVEEINLELTGAPISLEPRLFAEIHVFGPLSARANVGWEGSASAPLDGHDALPAEARLGALSVGWNGLRGRIGVAVRLGG